MKKMSSFFLILLNHFPSDNSLIAIVGKITQISEPKVVPRELRLICQNAIAHSSGKDEIFFQKVDMFWQRENHVLLRDIKCPKCFAPIQYLFVDFNYKTRIYREGKIEIYNRQEKITGEAINALFYMRASEQLEIGNMLHCY